MCIRDSSTTGSSCDQAEPFYPLIVGLFDAARANSVVGGLCLNQLNNDFDALGTTVQNLSLIHIWQDGSWHPSKIGRFALIASRCVDGSN